MKYYAGDDRDTDIDIPTADDDPETNFLVGNLQDNCYAYALNLYGAGSINPGFTTGSEVHGGKRGGVIFTKACEADGLTSCQSAPTPLFKAHSYYTIALFGSGGDMHWARVDSRGNWSDKMPRVKPTYSSFQNKNLSPHEIRDMKDWVATLVFFGSSRSTWRR